MGEACSGRNTRGLPVRYRIWVMQESAVRRAMP